MKSLIALTSIALLAAALCAAAPPPDRSVSGFERLKVLLGTWNGRDSQKNGVTSRFRLVADQTAIMETFIRGEANETVVRVYYADNGALMVTQYGVRGNQPRMRIDPARSNDSTLVFTLLDVTDPWGARGVRIRDLVLNRSGRTLLTESWRTEDEGTETMETAVLERASLGQGGAGLERLKSLIGAWKGKDERGNSIGATYAMIADSTGLEESLDINGTHENMVTVYTLSGGNTVLTHFCSMGNQPRMRLDAAQSDERTMVFRYVDATNVRSERDPRMHDLTLRFKDMDHFSQEWFLHIEGKTSTTVYEFERVRAPEASSGW